MGEGVSEGVMCSASVLILMEVGRCMMNEYGGMKGLCEHDQQKV